MTVAITRLDTSASELREAAAGTDDAQAARRMLAMAMAIVRRGSSNYFLAIASLSSSIATRSASIRP
jgi:hypothetical protein